MILKNELQDSVIKKVIKMRGKTIRQFLIDGQADGPVNFLIGQVRHIKFPVHILINVRIEMI